MRGGGKWCACVWVGVAWGGVEWLIGWGIKGVCVGEGGVEWLIGGWGVKGVRVWGWGWGGGTFSAGVATVGRLSPQVLLPPPLVRLDHGRRWRALIVSLSH